MMMTEGTDNSEFLDWFRLSSPYIQAHRNKTCVVCLPGEAIDSDRLAGLMHDLALLSNLGIRLIVVYGIRSQVQAALGKKHKSEFHHGLRVTDDIAMQYVIMSAGAVRIDIEAMLSRSLVNLPVPDSHVRTVSGNFITAKPYGVHDGIDFMHTGIVRRVDAEAIYHLLGKNVITLIPPLGYSPTGEVFNLSAGEVAESVAIALSADKLIMYTDSPRLRDSRNRPIRQLTSHEAENILRGRRKLDAQMQTMLKRAVHAAEVSVQRIHLVSWKDDGAIIRELFTRDGVGTLVSAEPYDTIRQARTEDIPGIMQIIEILEQADVLVKRPRDKLELEIDHFIVAVRDEAVIGCASVFPYIEDGMAELACLAMDESYQGSGGGQRLLAAAEQAALSAGVDRLFVLTTRAAQWFRERGFEPATIDSLPIARRRLYNYRRQSKVYIKKLG